MCVNRCPLEGNPKSSGLNPVSYCMGYLCEAVSQLKLYDNGVLSIFAVCRDYRYVIS